MSQSDPIEIAIMDAGNALFHLIADFQNLAKTARDSGRFVLADEIEAAAVRPLQAIATHRPLDAGCQLDWLYAGFGLLQRGWRVRDEKGVVGRYIGESCGVALIAWEPNDYEAMCRSFDAAPNSLEKQS